MAEIKLNGKKANESAPAKEAAKAQPKEDSTVKKVQDFLKSKGQEGATAAEIAKFLGEVKEGMTKEEIAKATRKVRVIARKAVDTHPRGKREVRNGRNKVYQIL